MNDIQQSLQTLLEQKVEDGSERSVQLAIYYRGELIVDAYAGIADQERGTPVDGDTLFPVFSTTKGVAATIIHLIAERGQLDYDMKICEIWPEFSVNGKAESTIGHALYHTTGIPHMPEGIGFADVCDWDKMCEEIARLTPQWPPGEHLEYHAITYGWILGEIARRVDGRAFSQILKEDICDLLGIKDMYVGISDEVEDRVAVLEEPNFVASGVTGGLQSVPAWICPLHEWMNEYALRKTGMRSGQQWHYVGESGCPPLCGAASRRRKRLPTIAGFANQACNDAVKIEGWRSVAQRDGVRARATRLDHGGSPCRIRTRRIWRVIRFRRS